jgi:hypothetical protein
MGGQVSLSKYRQKTVSNDTTDRTMSQVEKRVWTEEARRPEGARKQFKTSVGETEQKPFERVREEKADEERWVR